MNMPAKSGNSVHQIIADYPAKDLTDFVQALSHLDFIIVDEVYKNDSVPRSNPNYYSSQGPLALNPLFIGKVKILR